MGRKGKSAPEDGLASPKRLRGQLRRADAKLARARDKRDRAQARVEALAIIADEIRATLAEVEKAAVADAPPAPVRPATKPAAPSASRRRASATSPAGAPGRAAARPPARKPARKPPADVGTP